MAPAISEAFRVCGAVPSDKALQAARLEAVAGRACVQTLGDA